MNFTASWMQIRSAFSVGVLDQPPSAPPSAPPLPAPASAPPSAKSVASPSTDVAATIRDVRVSITRTSIAMCAFFIPPAIPPRTRPAVPPMPPMPPPTPDAAPSNSVTAPVIRSSAPSISPMGASVPFLIRPAAPRSCSRRTSPTCCRSRTM